MLQSIDSESKISNIIHTHNAYTIKPTPNLKPQTKIHIPSARKIKSIHPYSYVKSRTPAKLCEEPPAPALQQQHQKPISLSREVSRIQ